MILVDTSVWIDFFHGKEKSRSLVSLLEEGRVVLHPWVLGELLLGNLGRQRKKVLEDLQLLPQTLQYDLEDLIPFVEREKLFAKGLSLVDLQILYAAVQEKHFLWSHDRQLASVSRTFRLEFFQK